MTLFPLVAIAFVILVVFAFGGVAFTVLRQMLEI
jgi:hypothetical protein